MEKGIYDVRVTSTEILIFWPNYFSTGKRILFTDRWDWAIGEREERGGRSGRSDECHEAKEKSGPSD